MGTGSFPGVQRPERGVDHPPHLALRLNKEYSYTPAPPLGLRGLLQGELHISARSHTFMVTPPATSLYFKTGRAMTSDVIYITSPRDRECR